MPELQHWQNIHLGYTTLQVNISQISEALKNLCSRNSFIFVEHKNIGFDDLLVKGIHLLNCGKTVLGSNFDSEVNRYFGKSDNFLGNFLTYI